MKTNLDCIPCFIRQGLQAARYAIKDESIHEEVLREILRLLLEEDWRSTPPALARIVHRTVREQTRSKDPYLEIKKNSNELVLAEYTHYMTLVEESADPFLTALKLAIAGNIIDYGALSEFNLEQTVQRTLNTPPAIDRSSELRQRIAQANHLFYLADNAGEIVFDRIFLETILKNRKSPLRITFVVKGGPILNDATEEDAEAVGITQLPNLTIQKVGVGMPDTGPERDDPEFLKRANAADVVICKGQGNYEGLSEHKDFFFLLLAKCPVVAHDLGVPVSSIIILHE